MLPVFGFDDAPHGHGEVVYDNVRVPASSILLGEGRGFEIAQGRLGPGRIHHCMRAIGQAEYALEKMCKRALSRHPFGKPLAEQTVTLERLAESRIRIDQSRLLVLDAADKMDKLGNKAARVALAEAKVAVPNMLCQVLDWAIQLHGAAGMTTDFGLGFAYAHARTLRLVDGPDEVHRNQIGRLELAKYKAARPELIVARGPLARLRAICLALPEGGRAGNLGDSDLPGCAPRSSPCTISTRIARPSGARRRRAARPSWSAPIPTASSCRPMSAIRAGSASISTPAPTGARSPPWSRAAGA